MREIEVNDLQSHLRGTKAKIVRALRLALAREGVGDYSLSVAVVDDERISDLHRRFLNRTEPTDVLSFPLSEGCDDRLSGEIVVSAERAVAVAGERGSDPVGELLLYVVHGCLHLLGYDDAAPGEAARMHAREEAILSAMGYANAYHGPAGKV